jgi:sugar O-acyltransferase (sialic acid O-acetyltransferase NeuD family)
MDRVIIIGSQGHAKVVVDIVEQTGRYEIVGLLDRFRTVGERAMGYEILGGEEDLPRLMGEKRATRAIVAIGDNCVRHMVTENVSRICPELELVCAIHPTARVSGSVSIDSGTVVMAGATINPGCRIGRSCILNTNCSIDHDSSMGDFSSLGPNVATGGYVEIGAFTAVGIGATVSNSLCIGPHSVIGAGATVLEDIGSHVVAYGTPAKVVRGRAEGEAYIKPPRMPAALR